MGLHQFYKEFGLQPNIANEKVQFVNRINQTIMEEVRNFYSPVNYEGIFLEVSYKYGVNGEDMIKALNRNNYGASTFVPSLRKLTNDDFNKTLEILILLYESVGQRDREKVNHYIELALSNAKIDLGIRWKDGMFYPSGAKELDQKLIDDNLEWLNKYPAIKGQYSMALSHFSESLTNTGKRKDAITNSYTSVESLAQEMLSNKKNFDKNSDLLVTKLQLPKEYSNILHYYKEIANEYSSRHNGSNFNHNETEAFVYLTGLLIRLIIQNN